MQKTGNRNKGMILSSLMVILLVTLPWALFAQGKSRDQIDDQYKWNLADIYPTLEDWKAHKATFPEKFEKLKTFKGTLGKSGGYLFTALKTILQVQRELDKLWVYASILSDQDTRKTEPMAMKDELDIMWTTMSSNLAYLETEILSLSEKQLKKLYKQEPKLEKYHHYIDNIQRMKSHMLGEVEENLLSKVGLISGIASDTHNIISNADLPYPVVEFSDGAKLAVDVPTYARYRGSSNREDRIKAFNAFYTALKNYKLTYGTLLNGQIRKNLFYKGVRNYDSVLELALYYKNVPTTVYTNLIVNVHKHLPKLHRYLRIKKQLLGLDTLCYHDLYPDIVKDSNLKYEFEDAKIVLKEALSVLGEEYTAKLDEAYSNRWIDVYSSPGKANGAYCDGCYDSHPYVKLNYNDRFPDMSMLAHELGHAIHSYYANKTQDYVNAGYSSFTAEIAATTNESLLADHVINSIDDPQKKLALLGSWAEAFRTTLFRQTLFAEYEMVINEMAEKGETLNGNKYTEIYLDMLKKYYGHDEGVVYIDDLYGHEWAYISHFFLRYYNFQYATSYTAALALAEKMRTSGDEMVQNYLNFLSSGGADYPLPTLMKLGIDMTTDEPFELAMAKLESILDEIEEIIENQ